MTVFDTTPIPRQSQAESCLTFALMRPGNLISFHENLTLSSLDFTGRQITVKILVSTSSTQPSNSYAQRLVINTGTPVQKLQLYNWQLNISFCYFYLTSDYSIHEHNTFEK